MTDLPLTFCLSCGADIPAWFDVHQQIYDVAEDDESYVKWLDAPCPECGETPRENGAK